MISLPRIWITATLTLLALTACSNSTPPTAESSPASTAPSTVASPASTPAATNSETKNDSSTADPKATFANMKAIVAKTTKAVNAGNFAKAQEEFKDFDDGNWMHVEDGVKAKSANTYKQVEDNLDSVNNGIKAAKPDKAKVLAALQSLSKTLNSYTSKN